MSHWHMSHTYLSPKVFVVTQFANFHVWKKKFVGERVYQFFFVCYGKKDMKSILLEIENVFKKLRIYYIFERIFFIENTTAVK